MAIQGTKANASDDEWKAKSVELHKRSGQLNRARAGIVLAFIVAIITAAGIAMLYGYNGPPSPFWGQGGWWNLSHAILLRDALIIGSVGATAMLVNAAVTGYLCMDARHPENSSSFKEMDAPDVQKARKKIMDRSSYNRYLDSYTCYGDRHYNPNWLDKQKISAWHQCGMISTELEEDMTRFIELQDKMIELKEEVNKADKAKKPLETLNKEYKLVEAKEQRLTNLQTQYQSLVNQQTALKSEIDKHWTTMEGKFTDPTYLASERLPIGTVGKKLQEVNQPD